MNDLRSRTAAMLDGLSDEQLVLVQDYARYLRDRLAWGEPEGLIERGGASSHPPEPPPPLRRSESGSASSLASVSGWRDDDHALQALLEGA